MNSTVNNLKIIATIMVCVCHCGIVCNNAFGFELSDNWQVLLKTPAWGGVFIFFIISGFLASMSLSICEKLSTNGMRSFIRKKIQKVYIPCVVFISLAYLLTDPKGELTWVFLLKVFTCTFNGSGSGIKHIGASWYVFVLMWLFILTPVIKWMLDKWEKKNQGKEFNSYMFLLCAIVSLGLVYRIAGRWLGLEWYSYLYANVIGSLDLYMSGMIAYRMSGFLPPFSSVKKRTIVYMGNSLLIVLSISCCYLYYYGEKDYPLLLSIYRYITPSFYIVIICSLLTMSVFNSCFGSEKNPLLSKISGKIVPYTFQFYLWHSIIYAVFADKFCIEDNFFRFLSVLFVGSMATGYVAILMTKMNKEINKSFGV